VDEEKRQPGRDNMPREKSTETIHIILDSAERLVEYRLDKISGGRTARSTPLMLDHFQNRPIGDILRLNPDRYCALYPSTDNIPQHTFLRHFIALRSVLDAYTGRLRGGPGDVCSIISIDYENDAVCIDAILYSNNLNDQTDFCVRCPGCRRTTGRKLKRNQKPKN
jgi:hypothetical protein